MNPQPYMIYREMPATWNPAFRRSFYARWGNDNAIICAKARAVEYPHFRQLLSVKAAFGGAEEYFVDGRRMAVDDDTYLILNHGRTYASRICALRPVRSFSIFFTPDLLADVHRGQSASAASLLDDPGEPARHMVEFAEDLRPHDGTVSPALAYLMRHIESGMSDGLWIHEQLYFLLYRMLRMHRREQRRQAECVPARGPNRKELFQRMGRGVSFINTHYQEPIGLAEIAAAARLSRFHFLRIFKMLHGVTPSAYLNQKRVRMARRLLATTTLSRTAIADQVGFTNRTTLFRHLRGTGA